MSFVYSKTSLSASQRRWQRILEIVPGLCSWSVLLGLMTLSIASPLLASVLAIAFIFYWFLRLIYVTIFLLLSFSRLQIESRTDWMGRVKDLDQRQNGHDASGPDEWPTIRKKLSAFLHHRKMNALKLQRTAYPPSGDIFHAVIFPVAKEPEEVLKPAFGAILHQTFPTRQILVIYAVEETAPEETKQAVTRLIKEHREQFLDFLMVIHPAGLPGEARVKGANASYAARRAASWFKANRTPLENITVSCFDSDTVVGPDYFACLTYNFLVTPDRCQASFQPIPVYNNNIWSAPGFSRVMEIGSSFYQLIEATDQEKLVTFSSHSMSLKALVEIDYWPRDMISDDSAIFWKAFLHYQGRYRVVPLFTSVSMDATVAGNWWQTMRNIYKQRRRWAYGAENFPLLVRGLTATQGIPLRDKIGHGLKMLEGHVSWATWGFLLTTIGWLPGLFAGRDFQQSVLYYNEPHITGTMFNLSSFSLAISIFVSILLLPPPGQRFGWIKKILHIFEWLAIPFVLVALSAAPALDAQTRLMFGRYMEFWVTDKKR